MEGIVGEGVMISAAEAQSKRPSTIAFDLAKHLLYKYFKDEDGEPKLHLFGQIKRIARQWIDDGYLECKGDTGRWMLEYLDVANQASERIYNAIVNSIGDRHKVKAVLDPYNPKSSTAHVGFLHDQGFVDHGAGQMPHQLCCPGQRLGGRIRARGRAALKPSFPM